MVHRGAAGVYICSCVASAGASGAAGDKNGDLHKRRDPRKTLSFKEVDEYSHKRPLRYWNKGGVYIWQEETEDN